MKCSVICDKKRQHGSTVGSTVASRVVGLNPLSTLYVWTFYGHCVDILQIQQFPSMV